MDSISVVGLGKLGQCLAIALASRNFKVYGIDIQEKVIESLNKGVATINEPYLQELLVKHRNNVYFQIIRK